MKHSIDFFRDEIRNGFYIPTQVKMSWACDLDVLSEIDRICKKYDITYFADWGTFLGAVRHGGYIPWDDDMDLCMLREDYKRFREVADTELPEGYVIHDYERQNDHWFFLTRIVKSSHISFDEKYLSESYNFPWLSGIDIFIKDYLYADQKAEKARDKEILEIIAVADGITDGSLRPETIASNLDKFSRLYHTSFPNRSDKRALSVAL